MWKHLVTRGLAPKRRAGLTVEALESRLLLSGDMVLRWNSALLAALRTANPRTPVATRAAAIVQAAVYDAVNSIDQSYTPYLAIIPAPSGASLDAAAAQAAHDALVGLFPAQASVLDLELKGALRGIQDDDAKSAGIVVGQAAAQNILAARANDGSDKTVDYTPGTNPGDWQPTPPAFGPPVAPQWPQVIPFCLPSGAQFRPGPPPALTSPEYTAAFNQVKELGAFNSATRTADQTEAAIFWQGIVSPSASQWNQIAEQVAVAQGNTLVQNARMFALLNLASADSIIACWDAKYTYNFWRPVAAIRAADTTGNPDTRADPNWTPLLATPSHPSYPSAHASESGADAAALGSFFGMDAIPFSFSWEGFPGVTRSFDSFSAAALEAGMSRIWVGYHWSFDVTAGEALGQGVGTYVAQNFLLPLTPPPGGRAAPILVASQQITALEAISVSLGSLQPADATGAALPGGQSTVYLASADATSSGGVSEIHAMVASRARPGEAQPQTRASSVDDVFGSADPWQERLAPA